MRFAHRCLVVMSPWPPFWWETTELVALWCVKHRRTWEALRPGREAARATLVRVCRGSLCVRCRAGSGEGAPVGMRSSVQRGAAQLGVESRCRPRLALPCPRSQASGSPCRLPDEPRTHPAPRSVRGPFRSPAPLTLHFLTFGTPGALGSLPSVSGHTLHTPFRGISVFMLLSQRHVWGQGALRILAYRSVCLPYFLILKSSSS